MGVSGIEVEKSVTTVGISPWLYLHWCMRVCMGSSVRSPAVRRQCLCRVDKMVVNAQIWIWCRLIRVWMAK